MVREGSLTPLIVSTWSFGLRGNVAAWPSLFGGGSSLDAVERVCAVVDADPEVDSVGYGGLPDAAGGMSLDGCVMLAPDRCGSVCAIGRHLHPVTVARRVMERTPHIMLAGERAAHAAGGTKKHDVHAGSPKRRTDSALRRRRLGSQASRTASNAGRRSASIARKCSRRVKASLAR